MSINLHCNKVELRQTPTYVTEMCLVDKDGMVDGEVKGVRAVLALQIYIKWCWSCLDGPWDSKEDLDHAIELMKSHVEEVNNVIKNNKPKDIEVYLS